jgi:hypothetical protein
MAKKYYFNLLRNDLSITDENGADLPGDAAAIEHGHQVAHDLIRGNERSARHWRLRIHDEAGAVVGDILFASVDPTLDCLPATARHPIEEVFRRYSELAQTAAALKTTLLETRCILARHERKPFLAAVGGRAIASDVVSVKPMSGWSPAL